MKKIENSLQNEKYKQRLFGGNVKFIKAKKKDLVFSSDHNQFSEIGDDRTFSGVAYSGKMIKGHAFWGDLIFDVASMKSKPKIPILFNHDMEKIVGSGTLTFKNDVKVSGTISNVTEHGKYLYDLIKGEGFPMQESVYIEPETIRNLQKNEKMTVNGQEVTGPATIFMGGKIKEVSLTPLGADSETSTTIFNQNEEIEIQQETTMTEEMKQFAELFTKSPEEAFQFACSCEAKKTEEKSSESSSELEALKAEVAALKEENEKLKAAQKEKASLERKGRLEKTFKDLGVTLNPEMEEMYTEMSEEKFSKVIAGLEKDAADSVSKRNAAIEELTKYKDVKPDAAVTDKDKEALLFSKAREIRANKADMGVAASLEEARKVLNIK